MKKTTQTILTSAMFAAASASALHISAEENLMQKTALQMAPLYGPPPVELALGDINEDKEVDARDLTLLKQMVLDSRGQIALDELGDPDGNGFVQIWSWGDSPIRSSIYVGDLNQDYLINKDDVKALIRQLTGKPEEEEEETEPAVTTMTTIISETEMTQTAYGPPPAWK